MYLATIFWAGKKISHIYDSWKTTVNADFCIKMPLLLNTCGQLFLYFFHLQIVTKYKGPAVTYLELLGRPDKKLYEVHRFKDSLNFEFLYLFSKKSLKD